MDRVHLAAIGSLLAWCAGCGSSSGGAGPRSSSDAATGDDATTTAPSDAGAGSQACDAGAAFTYQYPGEAPRTGCLSLPEGVRIFYIADDGGCDGSINDTSAFAATPDNSLQVNVISFGRELFAEAGAAGVYVQFSDVGACPGGAGPGCSTAFGSARPGGCTFSVDVAGHEGDMVAGSLTAPCTLASSAMDASPASVSLQSLTIRSTVVAICP